MSAFKYFAPPEWDADVPEITEGINLTKKNKLRKKVKYSNIEKSENAVEDLNKINNLPLKRKNDPFEVITPKKKKRKNESGTYVKFDSPKINNTLTDSFQLEINNIAKSVNKNDTDKNHSKSDELDVDVNINRSNENISKKKKKKDKQKKSDIQEVVLEKKQKKSKNDEVNNTAIVNSQEVLVENNNKAKKKKKNKIEPMEIETNASDDVNPDENQIPLNGVSKNKKDKKNKIKHKEIVADKTVSDNIDNEEHEISLNGIGKNKKEKKKPTLVSNKSLNEGSDQSNKKLSKKSKNKLKKDKKKQAEVPKDPITPPPEPVCTVAAQIVVNKSINNKKSNLHVRKLKQLLDNMKPNTETTADDKDVKNENTAILSSLNDKVDTQKNIISLHKSLRERMMERLKGARFRYINEQLYVKQSSEAHHVFKDDPGAFMAYHTGYRQQVSKWPINPLDIIIKEILKLPKDQVVADLGCGDARLSKSVPHKVFSFDLVALDPSINACDMSHTPLLTGQVNVIVFCLSLMSTNLKNYLIEANRILKTGGLMKIAEVESRFNDVDQFITDVKKYGFSMVKKDLDHNLFYFIDFKKENDIKKRNKLPDITLNACLYKKR